MFKMKMLVGAVLSGLAFQASAVGNLADVRVFDRSANTELPIYMHRGKAYVVGTPGNEYQIKIRNQVGVNVMAVAAVDGINVITGKTASFNQSGYLISPWSESAIAGWRKSMDETASFYFTSLGDSYAGRTSRPGNVGVIGVAIFRQKPAPLPPPVIMYRDKRAEASESRARSSEGSMSDRAVPSAQAMPESPLGTGHGRREESNARYVEFERENSRPNEVISILYDSYDNLVSKGVIPVYRHQYNPRTPNAFPDGFVPDPR